MARVKHHTWLAVERGPVKKVSRREPKLRTGEYLKAYINAYDEKNPAPRLTWSLGSLLR